MKTKLSELSNVKMSFNLMPSTLLSSQQSDFGDNDLVKMTEASESTNTKRTTNLGFTKLTKEILNWICNLLLRKNYDTLRKFYAEVKSAKRAH